MPKICPRCNSQVMNDTANFCPQCGQQLTGEPLNPAWIAAMQEKIKDARVTELLWLMCGVIGGVLAAIIIIPHLFLSMKWETMDWVEAIGFSILCIGGFASNDGFRKEKEKLINQLEKGK